MRHALSFTLAALLAAACSPALGTETAGDGSELTELTLEELMNIEVSVASKKPEAPSEAPGIVVVIPQHEFEVYGDRNLHQLLQRQPSVYTLDSFVYAENLAAFRGDMSTHAEMHTLVLFNGRPIRESAQGHDVNMYTTFPLELLESVELIRGPGSVLYGSNAFTGVINLKPRQIPEQPEFSFSSMAGSFGYYEGTFSGGGRTGDLGIVGAIRTYSEDGFTYQMIDAAGVPGEADKHGRGISAATHLEYRNFSFDFFGSDIDAFALGVQPFWSNPHHDIHNKKLFLNAGYDVPLHERMRLEINATYNLQENALSSPAPMMIGTNTSDLLGEVTLFANPTDALDLLVGFLQEYRTNYEPDDELFQSIPSYDYSPRSAYAQGDYKFGDTVKLILGTQWNESPLGDSDLISRYGVIVTPTKNWGVKLLRGEAYRGPVTLESDLNDPPILVGNNNLGPEMVTTYDAQLFYQDEKTYAAVTYFTSRIEDLIIYDPSVFPMSYMNGGKEEFDGIELEAKRYLAPHWHLLGSFMHQENDSDEGPTPSVVPENMVKVGTDYSWDWGTAAIFVSHFGKPPIFPSPLVVNPEPKALSLVSMNLRFDVSGPMGLNKGQSFLTVRAENLLDEEVFVPTFAYIGVPNSFPYGPGRAFYIGLEVSF